MTGIGSGSPLVGAYDMEVAGGAVQLPEAWRPKAPLTLAWVLLEANNRYKRWWYLTQLFWPENKNCQRKQSDEECLIIESSGTSDKLSDLFRCFNR